MTPSYTYAILEVSERTYEEIKGKLLAAGYAHAFHTHEGAETAVIDMHGIGLQCLPPLYPEPSRS